MKNAQYYNAITRKDIERGIALGRLERSRAFHTMWKAVTNAIR